MTVLIYLSTECNFGCYYCFARPTLHNSRDELNIEAVVNSAERVAKEARDYTFVLHGGETGIISRSLVEYIYRRLKEKIPQARISIQTNTYALALNKELREFIINHVDSPGISLDGPPELTVPRGPFGLYGKKRLEWWMKAYEDVIDLIEEMRKRNKSVGIITILHKYNIGNEKRQNLLLEWFEFMLREYGITGWRFNIPFSNFHYQKRLFVDNKTYIEFYKKLIDKYLDLREEFPNLLVHPTDEAIASFFLGPVGCWQKPEAVYETVVWAIYPNGLVLPCDRWEQFGYIERVPNGGRIRNEILAKTDCKGCKYWQICYGGCPQDSWTIGAWFGKPETCEVYKFIFEYIEKKFRKLVPGFKFTFEYPNFMMEYYGKKRINPIEELKWDLQRWNNICMPCQQETVEHGDHTDHRDTTAKAYHNDNTPEAHHGDHTEHGDSHGDSYS